MNIQKIARKVALRIKASQGWTSLEILEAMEIAPLRATIEERLAAEILARYSLSSGDPEVTVTKVPEANAAVDVIVDGGPFLIMKIIPELSPQTRREVKKSTSRLIWKTLEKR